MLQGLGLLHTGRVRTSTNPSGSLADNPLTLIVKPTSNAFCHGEDTIIHLPPPLTADVDKSGLSTDDPQLAVRTARFSSMLAAGTEGRGV